MGLGGAVSGVSDELLKRWESMLARERRFEGKVSALSAAHDEVRGTLAVVHQTGLTLKRELERAPRGSGRARVRDPLRAPLAARRRFQHDWEPRSWRRGIAHGHVDRFV